MPAPSTEPTPVVQAAGGVLWRRVTWNRIEIAVVHRPRYDDWSLPKGKAKRSENLLVTALREVAEETGEEPGLGPFLTRFSYTPGVARTAKAVHASSGSPPAQRIKVVGYWAMAAAGHDPAAKRGEPVLGDEVDAVDWLGLEDAYERLSYPLDRTVLDRFAATPLDTVSIVVARAGHAQPATGDGLLRALDSRGHAQAAALVPVLRAAAPQALIAASSTRCVETLVPAAQERGLGIEVDDGLDGAAPPDVRAAAYRAVRIAAGGLGVGICVAGSAVVPLIRELTERSGGPDLGEVRLRKGGWWVLHLAAGRYVAAERHDP